MKNILKAFAVFALVASFSTSCIKEIDPQTSTVTVKQAASAPNSYQNFVDAITS